MNDVFVPPSHNTWLSFLPVQCKDLLVQLQPKAYYPTLPTTVFSLALSFTLTPLDLIGTFHSPDFVR